MADTISKSVGRGGTNCYADVVTIQNLLNNVPPDKGGLVIKLIPSSTYGSSLYSAIENFQRFHFGRGNADGRVDPGGATLQKLLKFGQPGGCGSSSSAVPAAGTGSGTQIVLPSDLSATRRKIVEIGLDWATPEPGKVSDQVTTVEDGKTVRAGWRYLKDFFDVAVLGWGEHYWRDPKYLAGVQIPGKRVPQPGREGMSWCGIFATYVFIKAAVNTKWVIGGGPRNLKRVIGSKGIQRGDMLVLKDADPKVQVNHHCIAADFAGASIVTINGNYGAQSILVRPKNISEVAYYYQPE